MIPNVSPFTDGDVHTGPHDTFWACHHTIPEGCEQADGAFATPDGIFELDITSLSDEFLSADTAIRAAQTWAAGGVLVARECDDPHGVPQLVTGGADLNADVINEAIRRFVATGCSLPA